ncbi:MAG: hypothetical protein ACKVVT_07250 [Dehalococcoidia bacterium]
MDAVIAGWAMGYAMAILSTFALTYIAVRAEDLGKVGRILGEGVSPLLLAVPVSLGTGLLWTFAGIVLGIVYDIAGLAEGPGFAGAPSAAFVVAMLALGLMPLPLLTLLWARNWWLWLGMSLAFTGLFGWVMPLLEAR